MRKILLFTVAVLQIISVGAQSNPPVISQIDDLSLNEGMVYSIPVNTADSDIGNLTQNPTIVVMGSSTAAGRGASEGNGWVDLLDDYLSANYSNYELRRLVKSGHTSYHFRETGYTPSFAGRPLPDVSWNITRAMTYNPDLIIVNLPSNDVANGFDRQETYDNFNAIKSIAEAGGSKIIFHTTQPRNFTDLNQRIELYEKALDIKSLYAPDTVNTYDYLVDSTDYTIKSQFNADDIHVNDGGHLIIYNRTIEKIKSALNGDFVNLSVSNLPSFGSFQQLDNGEGIINLNPGFEDAGIYNISIIARDEFGNQSSETFQLTINENEPKAGTQEFTNFQHTVNSGGRVDYYIYYPQDYDQYPNNRPILISLHGLGERGGSPDKMINSTGNGSHAWLAHRGYDFPIMIVSPHQTASVGGINYYTWNLELVKQIIEHVVNEYNVDRKRIYLTGFSNGAQSAWEYAVAYPEDIAALIPLAGRTNENNIRDPQNACKISQIPTRVFHGSNDEIIAAQQSIDMVNVIESCNPLPDPPIELNIIPGMFHDELRPFIYQNVSGTDNIYTWMLQAVKGEGLVDDLPPNFVNGSPFASNITDVSLSLNVSMDEFGTIYYALYDNGYQPTSEEVKNGSGPGLLFSDFRSNTQNASFDIFNLSPETKYSFWVVGEDQQPTPNLQTEPSEFTLTTLPEIVDLEAPLFDQVPVINNVSAGSVSFEVDISERGTVFWALYSTSISPGALDILTGENAILNGNQFTNGDPVSIVVSDLLRDSQYKLAIIAGDDEETPNYQVNPFTTTFSTDELDEGVIPDRVFQFNLTKSGTSSGLSNWNDLVMDDYTGIKVFNNFTDINGVSGDFSIVSYDGENGSSLSKVADNSSGYGEGIFPAQILRYAAFTTGIGKITISNLDPSKYYSFTLMGSRSGSGSRISRYTVNGINNDHENINNFTQTSKFDKISSGGDGQINVEFTKTNSSWGYLNGIKIEVFNKLTGDIEAPSQVQNVVAEGLAGDGYVNLSWDSSTEPDVESYAIIRSQTNEVPSPLLDFIISGGVKGTNFVDTVSTLGELFYWIIAVDGAGNYSELSEVVSATIFIPDSIPPVSPEGLKVTDRLSDQLTLSWTSNPEPDLKSYSIYRSESPGVTSANLLAEDIKGTSFIDSSSLIDGSTYYYRISATDLSGNISPLSNEISGFTLDITPPEVPSSLYLSAGNNVVNLEWPASLSSDIAHYNVFRSQEITVIIDSTVSTNPLLPIPKEIYLPLENNIDDLSGNNLSSSDINQPSYSNTIKKEGSYSRYFDGSTYIDLDISNNYIHTAFDQRSISLWIYPTEISGIYDIFDEGGSTNGIALRINNGSIEGAVQNGHTIRTISTPIVIDKWQHIALVFDSGSLLLYLNGELKNSDLNVPYVTVNDHGNGGGLGSTNGSNAFDVVNPGFNGYIDEFMSFGNVLSESQLSEYYLYYYPIQDTTYSVDTQQIGSVHAPDTTFIDNTAAYETEYSYFINAVDLSGNTSEFGPTESIILFEQIGPPDTPENLQITANGESGVLLTWNTVTSPGLSGYDIYRSQEPIMDSTQAIKIAELNIPNSYTDLNLQSESTYFYGIIAVNSQGDRSPLSTIVSYTTPDFIAPEAPSDLVTSPGANTIFLNWTESSSSDVDLYNIYRTINEDVTIDPINLLATTSGSYFEDSDVLEGNSYEYVVTAVDISGNESQGSNTSSESPLNVSPPSAPTNLTAGYSSQSIQLTWDSNNEEDFQYYTLYKALSPFVLLSEADKIADNLSISNFTDVNINGETTYYYALTATDTAGNTSPLSGLINITTPDENPPAAPSNLTVTPGTGVLVISWDPNIESDLRDYIVYGSTSEANIYDEPLITQNRDTPTTYDFPVSVQNEGIDYYFSVVARDSSGNTSPPTPIVQAALPNTTPPASPQGLNLTALTVVEIDWEDNTETDFESYSVWRSETNFSATDDAVQVAGSLIESAFTDSTVSEKNEYFYGITAQDNAGNISSLSSTINVVTPDLTAPSMPENLTASPFDGGLILNWSLSMDTDVVSYAIYGAESENEVSNNLIGNTDGITSSFSFEVSPELEDVTFYFSVAAIDSVGNTSNLSNQVSGQAPNITPPSSPSGFMATSESSSEISLNWNENIELDFANYILYRSAIPISDLSQATIVSESITQNFYVDQGLSPETTFYYALVATDITGNKSEATFTDSQTEPEYTGPVLRSTVNVNVTRSGSNSGLSDWNDIPFNNISNSITYTNLTDHSNTHTGFSLEVINGTQGSTINNVADNGSGLDGGILPNEVKRFAAYTTGRGIVRLLDLNPDNLYSLSFHSGRSGSGSRTTDFEINGKVKTLESVGNNEDTVTFYQLQPGSDGTIEIFFSKGSSSWGYLNAIIIEEYVTNPESNSRISTENYIEHTKDQVSVYPTPSDNYIIVKGDFPEGEWVEMGIYDISGTMILKKTYIGSFTFKSYSDLLPGIYFVKVNSKSGSETNPFIITK